MIMRSLDAAEPSQSTRPSGVFSPRTLVSLGRTGAASCKDIEFSPPSAYFHVSKKHKSQTIEMQIGFAFSARSARRNVVLFSGQRLPRSPEVIDFPCPHCGKINAY